MWTGTDPAGLGTKNDCVGWTSLSMGQIGTVGSFAATDTGWTKKCSMPCSSQLSFYCVEKQQ